jgi:hypothetical protein
MIWYLLSDLDRNDWRGNRVTQFSHDAASEKALEEIENADCPNTDEVEDSSLIILVAILGSLAHDGINPQRKRDSSRPGSLGFWQITGTS